MVEKKSVAIGVLDLQGGIQEHLAHLRRVGVCARPVKDARDFEGLAGLILPGGESTCQARLLKIFGLHDALLREAERGLKLWGTCAGAILLAKENIGETSHLALMDVAVQRNAFGTQLESFQCEASVPKIAAGPIPLTFIRSPKIIRAGSGVEVLLRLGDYIAAAEDDRCLVTVFHPELTPHLAFHAYFARKCGLKPEAELEITDPTWTRNNWQQISRTA
jgi:5'-phosphate synthase pdxT subunit